MVKLAGELVASPLPNEPGLWGYRKLSGGTLLLVQLTKTEWFRLHDKQHKKWAEKIHNLDKHPLNLAALTVLKRELEHPLPNEISLISLGRFALNEDAPDYDDVQKVLSEWADGPGTMQKAIRVLEEADVIPKDLLSSNLVNAAQLVLKHLDGRR